VVERLLNQHLKILIHNVKPLIGFLILQNPLKLECVVILRSLCYDIAIPKSIIVLVLFSIFYFERMTSLTCVYNNNFLVYCKVASKAEYEFGIDSNNRAVRNNDSIHSSWVFAFRLLKQTIFRSVVEFHETRIYHVLS